MGARTWNDDQLRQAVAKASSWRGVCNALGLQSANAASLRVLRRHSERLRLDTSHFQNRRTWSDESLRMAVRSSTTWAGVATALGLVGGGKTIVAIKRRTQHLGLDTSHLNAPTPVQCDAVQHVAADLSNLRTAATSIAMAWFLLRGCKPSLPVEPCAYDIVVDVGGQLKRVQVKTVTRESPRGWEASVSHSARMDRRYRITYTPDEVDLFFIIDGSMTMYLIPIAIVAGKIAISLNAYASYRVGTAQNFLESNGMWPSLEQGA